MGLTAAVVLGASGAAVGAGSREGVPELDHVFVIVLEDHNSFTSFGSNGILDNPKAPHIQALAKTYNFAANYHGAWHPSLPNYVAMITGDFVGTDAVATGHSYLAGSTVGIGDDDSPSVATDYPSPPANVSSTTPSRTSPRSRTARPSSPNRCPLSSCSATSAPRPCRRFPTSFPISAATRM